VAVVGASDDEATSGSHCRVLNVRVRVGVRVGVRVRVEGWHGVQVGCRKEEQLKDEK